MDGPLAPEPGDGRYVLVGVIAIVVIILGIVVMKHPTIGPAHQAAPGFSLESVPAPAYPAAGQPTAP
jgi:hypothetical protein